MEKTNEPGIFLLGKNQYCYRISQKINGKRYDTTCKVDAQTGRAFATKTAAKSARQQKINELMGTQALSETYTVDSIFSYYLENSALDKAHSTIVKQKKYHKFWVYQKIEGTKLYIT